MPGFISSLALLIVCPSVQLSVSQLVCPRTFLHNGWMDFLHIGYHDQVPWASDAYKSEFMSVPNLTNYGHFFITFECLLWYLREDRDFFHNGMWYNYQVWCIAHAGKIAFSSLPYLSNCGQFVIHFVPLLWYFREEWVDFYSYLVL